MIELRRAFAVAAGLTLLVIVLLTGCDLTSSPEATPNNTQEAQASVTAGSPAAPLSSPTIAPTPSVPQGGTLTIRIPNDVPDLKPWDMRSRGEEYVANLMYNGLVRLDDELRPQPDLAENWDVSQDGGLITFTIRSGVTWHDGQPLTSDDVVWTLNMMRTITPTNALLFDLRSTIGEISSPLMQTVVVSLTQPYAPLLAELAMPILPKHRLQDRTPEQLATLNLWNEPIGSGPFKFDQREPNQLLAFTRNEVFFRDAPNLERVALVVAPDPAIAVDALSEEQLLLAEFPAVEAVSETDSITNVEQGSYPENGWYGVVFNTRLDRLFADVRLREALAEAIDVPELVQAVTNGKGEPIISTLSRAAWAYPDDLTVPEPDLDAARQLLEQAGWTEGADGVRQKDGRPLAAQLWVRGDDARRLATAQRIAEAAQAIGMRLDITPANFDTVILAKLSPPYDFDLLLGSWVNAPNSTSFPTNYFYDPDDFALFHSSRVWQGQGDPRTALRNVGGFNNAEYDSAAEMARRTYDADERAAAIKSAQQVLVRERPYVLLWTDTIPVILNTTVKSEDGPIPLDTPRYLWNIEQWYLEE